MVQLAETTLSLSSFGGGTKPEFVVFEECADICRDGGGSGSEWRAVFKKLAQRQGSRYLNFATFRHLVITFTKHPTFAACTWAHNSPHLSRVSPLRFRLDFTAVHPLRIVELFTTEAGHVLAHHRQSLNAESGGSGAAATTLGFGSGIGSSGAVVNGGPDRESDGYEVLGSLGTRAFLPADVGLIRHRALRLSLLIQTGEPEPEPEPANARPEEEEPEYDDPEFVNGDDEDVYSHPPATTTAALHQSYWRHRWRTWILRMRTATA